MSFTGNTSNSKRDAVQVEFSQNIGNASTMSRSVDCAIAIERSLLERCAGNADSPHYSASATKLLDILKKPDGSGAFAQQRLLVGQLRPNLWVEEHVKVDKTKKKKAKKAAEKKKEPERNREAKDYYFFKSTDKEEAKKYVPQILEAGVQTSTPQVITSAPAPMASAPSAWNKGGTWEERNFTPFTVNRVQELLSAAFAPEFVHGDLKAEFSGWKVEGDAQLVLVRGKQRLGFEVSINAVVKGDFNDQKVDGKLIIPSVDMMEAEDGDFQVTLDLTKPVVGTDAYAAIRGPAYKEMVKRVQASMETFVGELRAEAAKQ